MTRPVALPIVVFLVVSAVASPLFAWVQDATRLDPDLIRLTVFSTAVGAAAVWGTMWRRLSFPPTQKTGVDRALILAVALAALAAGLAWGLARLQGAPWRPPQPALGGAALVVTLAVQTVGAAAEEVGWRGLVQPLLETRIRPLAASLLTGALFGLGHVYLVFAVPPLAFGLFLISAMGVSMILALATVGRSLVQRILIATLAHVLINIATLMLFSDGDGSVRYFATLALPFGFCGVLAAMSIRAGRRQAAV